MLFGHTYHLRLKVHFVDGRIGTLKTSVEARFCTAEEIVEMVKKKIEFEVGTPISSLEVLASLTV